MVTVTTTAMFIRHMRVEKAASVAKVPASQISRSAKPITGVFSPARMAAADEVAHHVDENNHPAGDKARQRQRQNNAGDGSALARAGDVRGLAQIPADLGNGGSCGDSPGEMYITIIARMRMAIVPDMKKGEPPKAITKPTAIIRWGKIAGTFSTKSTAEVIELFWSDCRWPPHCDHHRQRRADEGDHDAVPERLERKPVDDDDLVEMAQRHRPEMVILGVQKG